MNAGLRRGACPSVAEPMATGDGLLARLPHPLAPWAIATLAGLAAAARDCGNGLIEVTARGSLQVRGLAAATVPRFAAAVAEFGIDADSGLPVIVPPLAGFDENEAADVRPLARSLRAALAQSGLADALAPKVSVILDGGSRLHLDGLSADIRAAATPGGAFHIAIAGTAASATPLGIVGRERLIPTVMALLAMIAERGREARGRDIIASAGAAAVRGRLQLADAPPAPPRPPAEPIGVHPLAEGRVAVGIGVPFGQASAAMLERLVEAAEAAGADRFVPAAPRALLLIGTAARPAASLIAKAGRLGFITTAGDPRRFLAACAGAPDCTSARSPARSTAPGLATILAPILDGSVEVHISGCAKGCAHPGAAALTLVGTAGGGSDVIIGGRAGDPAHGHLAARDVQPSLARLATRLAAERRAGERTADVVRRLGAGATTRLLDAEPPHV